MITRHLLPASLIITFALILLLYYLGNTNKITLTNIVTDVAKPNIPSGVGGCYALAYDRNGNLFDKNGKLYHLTPFTVDFDTVAPVYFASAGGCGAPLPPDKVPPDIAIQGRTYFPLLLEVNPINKTIRSGESFALSASLLITDTFSSARPTYVIPISLGQKVSVTLKLATPSFDYSPSNNSIEILSTEKDIQSTWILTPKPDVRGEQKIGVFTVVENGLEMSYVVPIQVNTLLGVDPFYDELIKLVATVGGVVVTLLSAIEIGRRINPVNRQSKSAKRRR